MRSVQLFRKRNATRVFRSFWDSSRTQKYGRNSLNDRDKDQECNPQDPYELNYRFTECDQVTKVTVIGAAGRVGKTLSLLLKTCPLIDHLCLFDTDKSVKGVGVDISHIDTRCNVSYVCGMRNIKQALDAPDVVIIAAGCPTSPHLNAKKLFEKNAPVVASLSEACARFCPKACIILITSPINSLLPVVGGVFEIIANRIPSRKLFGLTTLDVVRANTFVAEAVRKDPSSMIVPVIGGTSQETLVPVISQMKPYCKIKRGEMVALTECLKRAEENLVDCQNCGTRGASSLSTAYAGFRFTTSLIMALKGAENIIECAFVKSDIIPELEYLASPLKLGIRGIEYNFGYPPLSDYEVNLMELAAPTLINDIEMGKYFVEQHQKNKKKCYGRCGKNTELLLNTRCNLNNNCGSPQSSYKVANDDCKKQKFANRCKGLLSEAVKKEKEKECSNEKEDCDNNSTAYDKRILISLPIVTNEGNKKFVLRNMWVSQGEESSWAKMSKEECSRHPKPLSRVDKPESWKKSTGDKGLCLSIDVDALEQKKRQRTDNYELAGFQQSAAVLMSDIKMGKAFVSSVEETIQEGIVWKRLTEDGGRASEETNQKQTPNSQEALQVMRKRRQEEKRRMQLEKSLDEADSEPQGTRLTQEVYSEGVRNWAANSSLKRLFDDSGEQENCNVEELSEDKSTVRAKWETNRLPYGILGRRNFKKLPHHRREYHTMKKRAPNALNTINVDKNDKYRCYLMEDRRKTLIPAKQRSEASSLVAKYRTGKLQSNLRKINWSPKTVDKYKDLNASAKQKFRTFNSQKKFMPSASALLVLDKKHKNPEPPATESKKIFEEGNENKVCVPAVGCKEDEEDLGQKFEEKHLALMKEKEKYREYIYTQLQELKKENEKLKRRLVELSNDKNLESTLNSQNEDLELERTKLKACWLIMSSTMEAFSTFCKKLITKTDDHFLSTTKELGKGSSAAEEENEEEEESVEEETATDASAETSENSEDREMPTHDKKYLKFLEKLMEDHIENQMEPEKRSEANK